MLPTLFIPHGGGPCFFMAAGEGFPAGTWDNMAAYLRSIPALVGERPRSLLVVSGHWEAPEPATYAPPEPKLLYDYSGFPAHTYRIAYPAPSAVALAAEVRGLLGQAGMTTAEDRTRGFDHGVFIPLKVMYPDADIPIAQLSLRAGCDPATHLAIGRALAPLREQGVLIVASGLSYHNLRGFGNPSEDAAAAAFDAWLGEAATNPDAAARDRALLAWAAAPSALAAHPTPEHFIPLLVAAGAAGSDHGIRDYSGRVFGKAVSGFRFAASA